MDQAEGSVFSHPLSLITSLPDIFHFTDQDSLSLPQIPEQMSIEEGFLSSLWGLFFSTTPVRMISNCFKKKWWPWVWIPTLSLTGSITVNTYLKLFGSQFLQ